MANQKLRVVMNAPRLPAGQADGHETGRATAPISNESRTWPGRWGVRVLVLFGQRACEREPPKSCQKAAAKKLERTDASAYHLVQESGKWTKDYSAQENVMKKKSREHPLIDSAPSGLLRPTFPSDQEGPAQSKQHACIPHFGRLHFEREQQSNSHALFRTSSGSLRSPRLIRTMNPPLSRAPIDPPGWHRTNHSQQNRARRTWSGPILGGLALLLLVGYAVGSDTFSGPPANAPTAALAGSRTPPQGESPQFALTLPAEPSSEEIGRVRAFHEPLVPVGTQSDPDEHRALALALMRHARRSSPDDYGHLDSFAAAYPHGTWTASVLVNLGEELLACGYYSRAMDCWRRVWDSNKQDPDRNARALADRAGTELAALLAHMGHVDELSKLLREFDGRTLIGSAAERLAGAREGLWLMLNQPKISYRCGPIALDRIRAAQDPNLVAHHYIEDSHATTNGYSMAQVLQLARDLGMFWQVAFRDQGAPLITPAVAHWKLGHFAALLRREGERYLVQDAAFRYDQWFTPGAIDEEASGYFLIPRGPLPAGWRSVSEVEAAGIWGKGPTAGNDPDADTDEDKKKDDDATCWGGKGMARYNVHLMLVNLNITDIPVGYQPPVGPGVNFRVSYNHREAGQPQVFNFSNLGTRWTFDWLCYLVEAPNNPYETVLYREGGGGTLPFSGYNSSSMSFGPQLKNQTRLTRMAAGHYVMLFPDGSTRIFGPSPATADSKRNVYLTKVVDPAGNSVSLTYDNSMRLIALTDAIGQVTTISYELASDPLKITGVTDPFHRTANFQYDNLGRLIKIIDVIGLSSEFAYEGAGDFIQAMTTPYGSTRFDRGENGRTRWLEITLPNGEKERVEFNETPSTGIPFKEPVSLVPQGMWTRNEWLDKRNTFYWDRRAYPTYQSSSNPYSTARLYHWLHSADMQMATGILESEKPPLENRIWYNYPGQAQSPAGAIVVGTSILPVNIGRVLDDGSTQLYQFAYNSLGRVTRSVDPIGRTMTYVYHPNEVDLLEIRQTTGINNDLIGKFLYNGIHLPVAIWDAAGQMTTNTYNPRGQLLTTTNPKQATQTYRYDDNGFLRAVDGPLSGVDDSLIFDYDDVGRLSSLTDPDSYTLTFTHDRLDRIRAVTYPDGTSTSFDFEKLDLVVSRDRLGRETHYSYDSLGRVVSVADPLHRITRYEYCGCGSIAGLIDPMGRKTTWDHDIEGRLITKRYVDGSAINYVYESASGRLKHVVDEKGQFKTLDYYLDNAIKRISYPNAQISTPSVSFTYDPAYPRRTSMQDGIGTTQWNYYPKGVAGALRIATEDGPWEDDTIRYEYDELGRIISRAIETNTESYSYDILGRATNVVNTLGSFDYLYEKASARLLQMRYPNGQTSTFAYYTAAKDFRLREIKHQAADSTALWRFTYEYDSARNITSWAQQAGLEPEEVWSCVYDFGNQLKRVLIMQSGVTNAVFEYQYDLAGNVIKTEQGGSTTITEYNALNQAISDKRQQVGSVVYEWDAEQRLVAINNAAHRSAFRYDGVGRRVGEIESEKSNTVSDKRFVWCGSQVAQERSTENVLVKQFYAQGWFVASEAYFVTRDHLGSVRDVIDATGNVKARYSYAPFGERLKKLGEMDADFGFSGHYLHHRAGLTLTLFRALDTESGRWLSRDLAGENGVGNVYTYVDNSPIMLTDPLGLEPSQGRSFCRLLESMNELDRRSDWLSKVKRFWAGWFPIGGEGVAMPAGTGNQYELVPLVGEVDTYWFTANYYGSLQGRRIPQLLYSAAEYYGLGYIGELVEILRPWAHPAVQAGLGGIVPLREQARNIDANFAGWGLAEAAKIHGLDKLRFKCGCIR